MLVDISRRGKAPLVDYSCTRCRNGGHWPFVRAVHVARPGRAGRNPWRAMVPREKRQLSRRHGLSAAEKWLNYGFPLPRQLCE